MRREPWSTAGASAGPGPRGSSRGPGSIPWARARLEDNDSNPALAASGDLVVTGPTNTNLLDLYLLLIEAPAK